MVTRYAVWLSICMSHWIPSTSHGVCICLLGAIYMSVSCVTLCRSGAPCWRLGVLLLCHRWRCGRYIVAIMCVWRVWIVVFLDSLPCS